MTEASDKPKVNLLDLPLKTIKAIEKDLGMPVQQWPTAPSVANVLVKVYAAGSGLPESEVEEMTFRELQGLVDITGDEGPTDPS